MLRSNGIRHFAVWFTGIAAASIGIGFAIGWQTGLLSLISAVAFGAAFFAYLREQRKRLAHLSDQIDRVLHNEDRLLIAQAEEGETSILESEITKLTLRLREQNEALKREKAHLADSLADIAHQLRTPLTSANLILSLLKKNPEEAQRRSLLRENEALLAQMDWLVNALLKLSRLDAGMVEFKAQPVEVSSLIQAALRPLLIPMELHDVTADVRVPQGVWLQVDGGWLTEALQNLLKNAMESAGDHGTLQICCENNPLYTEISIRDSGPGFAPEELPHLFERYYRGKSAKSTGYGIGLALCKGVITRQGGSLVAKNHPQGGAVFSVRFPK